VADDHIPAALEEKECEEIVRAKNVKQLHERA
jgi:vacuolar-type H+-ATPase subunit D/Vma8